METSEARAAREAERAEVESKYEDALIAASSAQVGTPRFLHAMADVREARHELRELYARPDPS